MNANTGAVSHHHLLSCDAQTCPAIGVAEYCKQKKSVLLGKLYNNNISILPKVLFLLFCFELCSVMKTFLNQYKKGKNESILTCNKPIKATYSYIELVWIYV